MLPPVFGKGRMVILSCQRLPNECAGFLLVMINANIDTILEYDKKCQSIRYIVKILGPDNPTLHYVITKNI